MAVVQTTPEQIAAVSPAAPTKSPAVETPTPSDETSSADHEPIHAERVSVPSPPEPPQLTVPVSAPAPEPETAEAAAQREQLIRELVGIDEEKPGARGADAEPLQHSGGESTDIAPAPKHPDLTAADPL